MKNTNGKKPMMRGKSASVGFALGAVLGSGIALLLAPAPGPVSRQGRVGKAVGNWRQRRRDDAKARQVDGPAHRIDSGRDAMARARDGR